MDVEWSHNMPFIHKDSYLVANTCKKIPNLTFEFTRILLRSVGCSIGSTMNHILKIWQYGYIHKDRQKLHSICTNVTSILMMETRHGCKVIDHRLLWQIKYRKINKALSYTPWQILKYFSLFAYGSVCAENYRKYEWIMLDITHGNADELARPRENNCNYFVGMVAISYS